MTDSLRKAFIAGWHAHMNYAPQDFPSDADIGRIFDGWHTYAYLPMTRDASADNPGPPPIPREWPDDPELWGDK